MRVPDNVRAVCATLTAAGHEAVCVGGAVRDALLGREPGDWDVASSARPEEVLKLFRHCIPTGLQHGTVTVVTGRGPKEGSNHRVEDSHVEVTTYRGDGAYTDGRRPDDVTFGVPLVEDLARRDLTVNAIAYDPERDVFHDPFDGRGDIANKAIRAVGDPVARFREDGLRVMRAVRFAAVLEFAIDPATLAAIPSALPVLAKVSRERVCEELRKILAAKQPSRGLLPAVSSGILATVAPTLRPDDRWWAIVDAAPARARLTAFLLPLAGTKVDKLLKDLKFSNDEVKIATPIIAIAHEHPTDEPGVRRILSKVGRELAPIAVEVFTAAGFSHAAIAKTVVERGDALVTGELAIAGADLMAAGMSAGPAIGKTLARLLADVLEDPTRNTRDELLRRAAA